MQRTLRTRVSQRVTPVDLTMPLAEELSSLTVNALKAHLCDRGLSTVGNKATLIDRLSQHVHANSHGPSATDNNGLDATQSSSSTGTQSGATNATRDNASSGTWTSTAQQPANLPVNLLQQLIVYFQQPAQSQDAQDDRISVASDVQPKQQQLPPPIANALQPPATTQPLQSTAVTTQPHQRTAVYPAQPQVHESTTPQLPPVPLQILEKIISDAYIDFTTLTSKLMFSTPEPTTPQSLTLQLTPSGDSFAIQPTNSNKRITSFIQWLEAWNNFMAITVAHKPSKALQLIANQSIISSASAHYPLNA